MNDITVYCVGGFSFCCVCLLSQVMTFVCGMNYSVPVHCSPTGHPWGSGGLDPTDNSNDYTPWNDKDLVVASTVNVQDESDYDPASITVQMSIWKELSAGQPSDETQVKN